MRIRRRCRRTSPPAEPGSSTRAPRRDWRCVPLPGPRREGRDTMQLAMIGLGRMGGNMVERLLKGGHEVVVFDRSAEAVRAHVAKGARGAKDLADACKQLAAPRVVWIMVPAGDAVESTLEALVPLLAKGDVVIEGGNSN